MRDGPARLFLSDGCPAVTSGRDDQVGVVTKPDREVDWPRPVLREPGDHGLKGWRVFRRPSEPDLGNASEGK